MKDLLNDYDPKEERINIITHLVGFIASIVGLVFLIIYAIMFGDYRHITSFTIFGVSMITLYLASTLYHSAKKPKSRMRLKIFDHSAIYLLIAGSYTPFAMVTLEGAWSWAVLSVIWGLAIIGIIVKLYHTGKFKTLSTLSYVLMGWVVVFAGKPLVENLSTNGLKWLIWGGASYLIGAVFYSIKKLPYKHAIFHCFVLVGTACHYFSVLLYVR